ncbi:LytR/AlgR family response regulator transcription factor [Olivibacter sitiensis]|uniref:LytR/AlgR family response regulator transcription factor n=1 Tax=Olivibacter sitiensis TaxID=376470 RepID=UPI000424BC43|nr:response regulator [Olivibacter sitiensis]
MKDFSVLIVEDEMIIANDLRDILEILGYQVCGVARSYEEAVVAVNSEAPNMILLDVMISGNKTGIDVANYLNEHKPIPFIYITSYTDQLTLKQAFHTKPLGYLAKPFELKDVKVAMAMAIDKSENADEFLLLPDGKKKIKISINEVYYAEADGNYTFIRMKGRSHCLRKTLKDTLVYLPVERGFVRIHKSYVVNLFQVRKIGAHEVVMANETVLPVGRAYAQELDHLK